MRILLLLLFPLTVHAVEPDKIKHVTVSYTLTNILLESGYTKKQAFWTVFTLGAIKEAHDHQNNTEHLQDMGANTIGSIGAITVYRWEIKPKRLW